MQSIDRYVARVRAGFVALFALTVACGGATANPARAAVDLSQVTLHVGDQTHQQQTLMTAAGQLTGTPYKVEWSQFTSGPPLLEALNAGGIDVGGVGDTPPIFSQAAGARLQIVATIKGAPHSAGIVVPGDSTVTTLKELRGKRIAVAKGSSAHYHLLAALRSVKLTFDDITPVYLQPTDAIGAFNGHSFDAWAVWDPYVAQAVARLHGRLLADGTGLVPGFSFSLSSQKALRDPSTAAAVGDYLQRLARAQLWANAHRQDWAAAYAQITGLDQGISLTTVTHRESTYVPIDDGIVTSQQKEADAFSGAGLIPSRLDVRAYFDRRFNPQIAAIKAS